MPEHHDSHRLAELGREWISAWNSRDLERVLKLYSDDAEMTSEHIPAMGFSVTGSLRGKENLRLYWTRGLQLLPELHFELIDLYVSPDSIVVFYRNERGKKICEYLRVGRDGRIVQGSANHLMG